MDQTEVTFAVPTETREHYRRSEDGAATPTSYQLDALQTFEGEQLCLLTAATGFGKSLVAQTWACLAGKTLIVTPLNVVSQSFVGERQINYKGKKLEYVGVRLSSGTALKGWADDPDTSVTGVCSHALARNLKKVRGLNLVIDETHSSAYADDDGRGQEYANETRSMVERFERAGGRVLAMTATPYRTDGLDVTPAGSEYVSWFYPMHKQLAQSGIEHVTFRFLFGDVVEHAHSLVSERTCPTLVYLPRGNAPADTKRLVKTLTKAVKGQRVENWVTQAGRDKRQNAFVKTVRANKNPKIDMLMNLNTCVAGFDWPAVERLWMVAPRNSLSEVHQIFGRAARYHKNKKSIEFIVSVPDCTAETDIELYTTAVLNALLAGRVCSGALKLPPPSPPGGHGHGHGDDEDDENTKAAEKLLASPAFQPELAKIINYVVKLGENATPEAVEKKLAGLSDRFPELSTPEVRSIVAAQLVPADDDSKEPKDPKTRERKPKIKNIDESMLLDFGVHALSTIVGLVRNVYVKCQRDVIGTVRDALPREEFVSLDECRAICKKAGVNSVPAYNQARKDGLLLGCPSSPRQVYGVSWAELFEKEPVQTEFVSVDECRKLCKKAGVSTVDTYTRARTDGLLPGCPGAPNRVYGISWAELFEKETEFVSVDECRKLCTKAGVSTQNTYRQARKDGLLPGCPSNPNQVYEISWAELFGSKFVSLDECRKLCTKVGVSTVDAYRRAKKDGLLTRCPSSPRQVYGVSWAELFGKESTEFVSVDECRKLCKKAGVSTVDTYTRARTDGLLPECSSNPDRFYEISWAELFEKETEFVSLDECRNLCKKAGVSTVDAYRHARKDGLLPGCPSAPNQVYEISWAELFGSKFVSLDECRKLCKKAGVSNVAEYKQARKDGLLPGCPSYPNLFYEISWAELFEKEPEFVSVDECRKLCAKAGVSTQAAYRQARKDGLLPGCSSNPDRFYEISWAELLGKAPRKAS